MFSSFSLAEDAQAPEAKPPASWTGDQFKGKDKIMFGTHLTMFAKVRRSDPSEFATFLIILLGRNVGEDGISVVFYFL